MKKRVLGVLLSFALALTMMPALSQTAYADGISYVDANGKTATADAEKIGSDGHLSGEWYYAEGNTTVGSDGLFFDRTDGVNLILCDGATLTVNGITAAGNLTIYRQSGGTGRLISNGAKHGIICENGDLTIYGGTVSADGKDTSEGILARNVTINGGTVSASNNGVATAIGALGTVTINGGTVSAIKESGIGITGSQGVTITGGNVTASGAGSGSAGIYSSYSGITITGGSVTASAEGTSSAGIEAAGNNKVTISGGEVTATGSYAAIKGKLENSIAGTGWTNEEGTDGKADIAEGEYDFEAIKDFKKVQFPAVPDPEPTPTAQSTITFDLNGGTLNGQTGTVTQKVDNGTVITLPAPARDGYTFDYWEGSEYKAGDKYTVNGDHTFKAIWKTADNSGSKGSGKKGVKTGDSNDIAGLLAVMLVSAGALGVMGYRRRKEDER